MTSPVRPGVNAEKRSASGKKTGYKSLQILKDSWRFYQRTVRTARAKYFSDIIVSNSNNPRVLFETLNNVLNAPQAACLEASDELCEGFLHFFLSKIESTRALICPPLSDPSIPVTPSAVFDQFNPVSLPFLEKIVGQMKPSGSQKDPLPPRFFKEVFPTVAPDVLNIINSSLANGIVPVSFKHAVVQPLIKKPGLFSQILGLFQNFLLFQRF